MTVASTSSLVNPSPTRASSKGSRAGPISGAASPASAIPRPIPNSYWATPNLLACEYPWSPSASVPKLDALLKAGVTTFIDLTEAGELKPYAPHRLYARAALLNIPVDSLEYHSFPIPDRSLPQSIGYMRSILNVLEDNERRGRRSAVHCRGGIGRTGMVVGCWLVECGRARCGDDALSVIAALWCTVEKCKRYPHSPETGPQFEFVRNFRRVRGGLEREAAQVAACV